MSTMTSEQAPTSLNDEVDQSRKPRESELNDVPLTIQFLLHQAFEHGQENPVTSNSVAFFDDWYAEKAKYLPKELRANKSICDLWDHLMEKEQE